ATTARATTTSISVKPALPSADAAKAREARRVSSEAAMRDTMTVPPRPETPSPPQAGYRRSSIEERQSKGDFAPLASRNERTMTRIQKPPFWSPERRVGQPKVDVLPVFGRNIPTAPCQPPVRPNDPFPDRTLNK